MINMKAMLAHLKYKQCLNDQAIVNNKLAGAIQKYKQLGERYDTSRNPNAFYCREFRKLR